MADQDAAKLPPVEEPAPAPEIYVDGIHNLMITGAVAKVAFISLVHDPVSNQNRQRVALRLAIPVTQLDALQKALAAAANSIRAATAPKA